MEHYDMETVVCMMFIVHQRIQNLIEMIRIKEVCKAVLRTTVSHQPLSQALALKAYMRLITWETRTPLWKRLSTVSSIRQAKGDLRHYITEQIWNRFRAIEIIEIQRPKYAHSDHDVCILSQQLQTSTKDRVREGVQQVLLKHSVNSSRKNSAKQFQASLSWTCSERSTLQWHSAEVCRKTRLSTKQNSQAPENGRLDPFQYQVVIWWRLQFIWTKQTPVMFLSIYTKETCRKPYNCRKPSI